MKRDFSSAFKDKKMIYLGKIRKFKMDIRTFCKDYRVVMLSTLNIDISENNHVKFKTEMTLLTIKAFRYRLTE